MGHRMSQVNELLRSELSLLLSREWELTECMITITHVKCSPNLLSASIYISVLPENRTMTAIKELKKYNSRFSNILQSKLNLKRIPRFHWKINKQEKAAAELDNLINEINQRR